MVTGLMKAVTDLYLPVFINNVVQAEDFFIASYSDFPRFVLYMADVWKGE